MMWAIGLLACGWRGPAVPTDFVCVEGPVLAADVPLGWSVRIGADGEIRARDPQHVGMWSSFTVSIRPGPEVPDCAGWRPHGAGCAQVGSGGGSHASGVGATLRRPGAVVNASHEAPEFSPVLSEDAALALADRVASSVIPVRKWAHLWACPPGNPGAVDPDVPSPIIDPETVRDVERMLESD